MIYSQLMMDQILDQDITLIFADIALFNQGEFLDINQVELVDLHLD